MLSSEATARSRGTSFCLARHTVCSKVICQFIHKSAYRGEIRGAFSAPSPAFCLLAFLVHICILFTYLISILTFLLISVLQDQLDDDDPVRDLAGGQHEPGRQHHRHRHCSGTVRRIRARVSLADHCSGLVLRIVAQVVFSVTDHILASLWIVVRLVFSVTDHCSGTRSAADKSSD